ncbi:MAG: hypothetical protein CMC13_02975 [Flavobacteriaceae bacterium]|nr:hypothetical protein [Flavobacteriaceae bacterium]|tara:strand:- start:1571 stop:2572 length:1002 start_codon:yes stop_codon:yes gene_type:complete
MKIALVLTVKNEARLLRNNLLYHRAIGAAHIFVYFDGTTDGGKASIQDLDFVAVRDSVAASTYQQQPFLQKFTSQAGEHHTARQCLNTYDAQQRCAEKGIDWLISIDADELVCPAINSQVSLAEFFQEIDTEVEVVYLQTKEALQRKSSYGNVFAEETLFKSVPTYESRFKNIYKQFYNPFTEQKQRFSYWYGQTLGKGAIRIGRQVIPHNVHRYKKKDGSQPTTQKAGFVLHYHAYDAQDFIKKFTNFSEHPDTFLSGNAVESLKLLLRDVVNRSGMSETELQHYFENNLMFHETEVKQLLANRYLGVLKRSPAPLTDISSVVAIFKSLQDT